ncbi:PaaX family transcriptional regulator C-terminal domain-containing protein [Arthrobacter sp. W4I7]|uniref:PaaX family transcriptional regulator n=1 Tax=Arthrobacter sp. W4I7 TaxID=3042296 RepID=UPI00278301BC|nr:PaaX family transcriptional regulator C-terminal domain-containing protein [Arthrobacter sp. W4I7]MDQ0693065.1 phenylacetic acid degradation operon negative regulatory protein [Arthrobacter sp. W4I7]
MNSYDLPAAGSVPPGSMISFPRPSKGGATQHLVLTMLGDYWQQEASWLPSRLIIALGAHLGITASAASTALSRLAGRGVLEQSSAGRSSRYRLTEAARVRLQIGFRQVSEFGSESRQWDGMWTVVGFSIPESARETRELLRSRLKWLGFSPLYGALWVCPWDRTEAVDEACAAYGVANYVVFRSRTSSLQGREPIEAWALDEMREQYHPFIETYSRSIPGSPDRALSPAEAFRLRTEIMDSWRAFPWNDPGLPRELLPADFPLLTARKLFVSAYNSLADPALEHVREVIRSEAPEAAGSPSALRVSEGA